MVAEEQRILKEELRSTREDLRGFRDAVVLEEL
jgi:hypothetical protein